MGYKIACRRIPYEALWPYKPWFSVVYDRFMSCYIINCVGLTVLVLPLGSSCHELLHPIKSATLTAAICVLSALVTLPYSGS
jgi:sterol desaturase/sphingolipid hydroxylase (fatty acid hydroxylase superfamily)